MIMAILGVQVVVTMVMASLLQKIVPHYSLGQWLLCHKLNRYLHPSTEDLKAASIGGQLTGKKGKKNREVKGDHNKKNGTTVSADFTVARNIEVQLDTAPIKPIDLIHMRFFPEFQRLIDFSLCTLIVYIVTEVYYGLVPVKNETNLSVFWCILTLILTLRLLWSITAIYFRGEESTGESSLCVTCGGTFLVIAMIILVVSEDLLEFGIHSALVDFHSKVTDFLRSQGLDVSNDSTSLLIIKFILASWCAFIGAFFTFPGLRLAKMHFDSLKMTKESPFYHLLFHTSFIGPLLVVLLWVKPISKHYFTERSWPGLDSALMTTETFEVSRLVFVLLVVLLRLFLMPSYLQAYLNMAHDRIEDMKKETGRISCIEFQRKVTRVFYYLCVVALQYLVPLLNCLFFALLFKTLGGYSWSSLFDGSAGPLAAANSTTSRSVPVMSSVMSNMAAGSELGESFVEATQQATEIVNNVKNLFTLRIFRGVLGFMLWWVNAVWFGTSAMGLVYHSYFVQQ